MPLADAVSQLAERCNAARLAGANFPTVWNTILKKNRLVLGIPIQALQDGKPVLKIRLTTKQHAWSQRLRGRVAGAWPRIAASVVLPSRS